MLSRRAAATLHAAGRFAEGDVLPMIARAAGPLGSLPAGSERKLTVSERRLVADVSSLDDARVARLLQDLGSAGLAAVSAPVAGGVRVAATAEP